MSDPDSPAKSAGTPRRRQRQTDTQRRLIEQRTQKSLDALLLMAQEAVGSGGDLPAIARRLAAVTCEVMGCRRVGVMRIEKETKFIRVLAVVGLTPDEERIWGEMPPKNIRYDEGGDPELLARFLAGEPLALDMTQPPFDRQPNPFGVTTALTIPILLDGQPVGLLALDHAGAPHTFTETELALARGVADLAALVIERDRMHHERAVVEAKALALSEASRQMDEFLKIAGHELRTPLTSAKVVVELATERMRQTLAALAEDGTQPKVMTRLNATVRILETSNKAMLRLSRLVNDLLEAMRAQADELEIQPAPLRLTDEVASVIAEQQALWPHRLIEFERAANPTVFADGDRIHQVVANFLINALKYAPPEAPITVRVAVENCQARVSVTDHGPGLTAEQQARVWERYYRVEEINRHEGSSIGLGLGLFIARTIMLRHGGKVGVESEVGVGSTFWLCLPTHADSSA